MRLVFPLLVLLLLLPFAVKVRISSVKAVWRVQWEGYAVGASMCVYGEGVVQGCGKSKGGREIRGGGWDGEGCVAGGKEGEFSRVAKRDGFCARGYPEEGPFSLSLSLFLPGRGRVILCGRVIQ